MRDIIIAIVIGIIFGWLDVFSYKTKERLNMLSSGCLLLMLACLGAKIGCDRELLQNMDRLGLQAVGLAATVVTGSVAMVYLISKIFAAEVAEAIAEPSGTEEAIGAQLTLDPELPQEKPRAKEVDHG